MKPNRFKVAHNTQDWWGFTLQRGHVFGLYQPDPNRRGVCYVSGGEPDGKRRNRFIVYRQTANDVNPNYYRWTPVSIPVDCELGKLILTALDSSSYDHVSIPVDYTRVHREWQSMPDNINVERVTVVQRHAARTDTMEIQFINEKPRPNFPTFQHTRPEYSPQPPKQRIKECRPDSYTHEQYRTIQATDCTVKIWADAIKAQKAAHREQWIREWMRSDSAAAERIYNLLYGEA